MSLVNTLTFQRMPEAGGPIGASNTEQGG